MTRHERLNALLALIAEDGQIDVLTASDRLSVSAATIRRDLDHLARQQMLTRTRGGAVAHGVSYDLPLRYKTARVATSKQQIGALAAGLIEPGQVVGLNGGTTTTEVARALAVRDLRAEAGEPAVTVVTNAVNIAAELTVRSGVKLVVTGGVARAKSYELIGPLASITLAELRLDLLFLGVNALHPLAGASAEHEGEAAINRLMVQRAGRVIVVADGSKLGRQEFARICDITDVDTLVTDSNASDAEIAAIADAGVEILRA